MKNLIKGPVEDTPVDEKAKAEEKIVTSQDGVLAATLGFNLKPFWFVFFAASLFVIALLFLLFFMELPLLHGYIQTFTAKDFAGNSFISSDFLLGLLTLCFSACGGTVFAIYKLLQILSRLKVQ